MERVYTELPNGLGEMTHIAQSDRELAQLHRTYLVPPGYRLDVRAEGMKVHVRPVLIEEPVVEPVIETPAAPAPAPITTDVLKKQMEQAESFTTPGLEKKTKADLLTLGAELGIEGLQDAQSKAYIISKIIEKRRVDAVKATDSKATEQQG